MRYIELLAPARDLDTALAAIRHGADAVYIGAPRFGARAQAGNSIQDIELLCRQAHVFRVRVYVTLNTILYDDELADAEQMVWQLWHAGVDALIVQDMALLQMKLPPIPLHASTQMDNRTPQKVEWLYTQGFRQAVLARELTLDEIADVHRRVPQMALEAFVHGATCVCYNGRCTASQHCFGRSANRGECAQFCRLPFDLLDADGHELQHGRHLLSLHDMNRTRYVKKMLDAGVTSLKIEGRLKDLGYVQNVTAHYRQVLDRIMRERPHEYARSSSGVEEFSFQPDPSRSFNRGFTDYFMEGRTRDMIQPATPKSMGQRVGTVKDISRQWLTVAGVCSFANGDGLCYIDDDGHLQGFRVNRVEGNRLYPQQMPRTLRHRQVLYRNSDQAFEAQLQRSTTTRHIDVQWMLADVEGGFTLTLRDAEGTQVQQTFACEHQQARTDQQGPIERQLSRLGDTCYRSTNVTLQFSQPWFIPASELSQWRRQLVDMLTHARIEAHRSARQAPEAARRVPCPEMPVNVSNRMAARHYRYIGNDQVERALEVEPRAHTTVMTTRYCMRYQLGLCHRHDQASRQVPDPLTLRSADGRRFQLRFDCKHCLMHILTSILMVFMLSGCYYPGPRVDAWDVPEEQQDSLDFVAQHHYSVGYNFTVVADSLTLLSEIPQLAYAPVGGADSLVDSEGLRLVDEDPLLRNAGNMSVDTFPSVKPSSAQLMRDSILVVADISVIPADSIDSVWVKVASTQNIQGWIHERELLSGVVPDDPISQAIHLFSNTHLWWTVGLFTLAMALYLVRRLRHQTFRMVHFSDICSPYPMLLCLALSGSAVLYASIQNFVPQTWAEYYYHPTLNPFALPPVLGAFLASLWLLLIFFVAAVDDVYSQLRFPEATLYTLSLVAFMAVLYVLFSLTTLVYVGYVLYAVYAVWSLVRYWRHYLPRYRCGQCGALMHDVGLCPRCGTRNLSD